MPRFPRLRISKRTGLLGLAGMVGLGLLMMLVFSIWWSFFLCRGDACPSVAQFDEYKPSQPARLYAADGRFIAEVGLERRSVVTLERIPQNSRSVTSRGRVSTGVRWPSLSRPVLPRRRRISHLPARRAAT